MSKLMFRPMLRATRAAGSTLLFCALTALAGLGVLGMSGCATQELGYTDGVPNELQTQSDDSPERKRARTRLALASGYFQNGQTTVALDEMKKALQIDPSFGDAYNLGGLIYTNLRDFALAQAHFEKALSLNPRDADAMHNLGWLKCLQREPEAGITWFQRALAQPTYNDKAKTWLTQGICQVNAGQRANGVQSLKRSYELDPGNPITAFNLAKLLFQDGEVQRAQFYVRRLNNSEQSNAESLWLGIRVERRLDQRQAMQQLASQLRRRFPDSKELQLYERGAFNE